MKKVIYKYFVVVLVLSLSITSCTNVLDKDPVDSFNETSIFTDVNLVEAFLYQC